MLARNYGADRSLLRQAKQCLFANGTAMRTLRRKRSHWWVVVKNGKAIAAVDSETTPVPETQVMARAPIPGRVCCGSSDFSGLQLHLVRLVYWLTILYQNKKSIVRWA